MTDKDFLGPVYGGKYLLKYTDGNHAYYVAKRIGKTKEYGDFVRKTGVTTLQSSQDKSTPMKYWVAKLMAKFLINILTQRSITKFDIEEAKGLHTKRLQEAATIGSKIHDWIESYIKGEQPAMPEEENILLGVNGFLKMVEQEDIHFVASEIRLYSETGDYVGTMDTVFYKGSKYWELYPGDYKTSTGLYNGVMLQTGAYTKAFEEMDIMETLATQSIPATGTWLAKMKKAKKKPIIKGRYAFRLEKRIPAEFKEEMDEKGKPNAKYLPFEVAFLDSDRSRIDEDHQAFMGFANGYRWDLQAKKHMESLLNK